MRIEPVWHKIYCDLQGPGARQSAYRTGPELPGPALFIVLVHALSVRGGGQVAPRGVELLASLGSHGVHGSHLERDLQRHAQHHHQSAETVCVTAT